MGRKVGQHGPYKVKSPGRAAALKRYRAEHNWSEEIKKIRQRPESKEKYSAATTKNNLKWWANATPEQRAKRVEASHAWTKKKKPIMSEAGRAAVSESDKRRAREDPNYSKAIKDRVLLAKEVYDKFKKRDIPADWLSIKKMTTEELRQITKKLPD